MSIKVIAWYKDLNDFENKIFKYLYHVGSEKMRSRHNQYPDEIKKKLKRQYQSNIHSNYGPRPMKLHKGMNLLAQSKNLYPRSLHWGMGQRYGKLKWHQCSITFLPKALWSPFKKTLLVLDTNLESINKVY